ncbi:MAG: fibronectin type III domain-containing protein [Elusimicrobia bacterium]|nr:fibronectin type III domain-containing protein [Elusimicrobiota bacterium]
MSPGAAALLLALAVAARAQGPSPPPAISGVSAAAEGGTGAVISWTTDQAADAEVDYGPSEAYANSVFLNSPPATSHSVRLTGLVPGALYHYRAKSRNAAGLLSVSEDLTFTTPPPSRDIPASGQALPLVLIMTPPAGAVVSGTATVSANASAGAGVASVQFLLDGQDLGPPLTAGPYTLGWDTSLAGDGTHALAAVVRDAAGRAATSPIVRVTTDNTPPVIGEVSASALTADGAVVSWTTSEPADAQVEYGMTQDYGDATPLSSIKVVSRGVSLTGLASEALYHFRVRSRDAAGLLAVSPDYLFATGEPAAAYGAAGRAAAAPAAAEAKAPQRVLTPALADGVNDRAVFGPDAREVSIVDIRGRRVFHESSNGGPLVWNGREASGGLAPSGVYIAVITTRDGGKVYQTFTLAK